MSVLLGWMGTAWAARIYIVPSADISLDVVRQSLNLKEQVSFSLKKIKIF